MVDFRHGEQAVKHARDVLDAAADFYKGATDVDAAARKLSAAFDDAMRDGTINETLRKAQGQNYIPNGWPKVIVDDGSELKPNSKATQHKTKLTAGLFESVQKYGPNDMWSRGNTYFVIETDEATHKARVTTGEYDSYVAGTPG